MMDYIKDDRPDGTYYCLVQARGQNCLPPKIYWLSRHRLLRQQIEALLVIHGPEILVIQQDKNFSSAEDFADHIEQLKDGFVYAVIKRSFISKATSQGLTIGVFSGRYYPYFDPDYSFELHAVYHFCGKGVYRQAFAVNARC